jgi:D-3-phosphoglycerate dehydrogenase
VIYSDIEHKLPLGNANSRPNLWEMLSEADVVSLHVPETALTTRMVDERFLRAMKRGSYVINASRGQVVDIDALAEALDSGHVAGAAIDVFPVEPGSNNDTFESRLRGRDNVLITPHIGGSTLEAQENIAVEVAGKLVKYSDNGTTKSAVNFPQVSLPDHEGSSRILHIHHNAPGVLQRINAVISEREVNIASQYLDTRGEIGYVVMDIETDEPESVLEGLRGIPSTIRARILH